MTDTNETAAIVDAMAAVLQKTDRIVSGDADLRVIVEKVARGDRADVAGWTDGAKITLNGHRLGKIVEAVGFDEAVRTVVGVNYHELAHWLFSPRIGTGLSAQVEAEARFGRGEMTWTIYNAIEDQRIESLFVARYAPAQHYFAAMIAEAVINTPGQDFGTLWGLLAGRLYLDREIVKRARRLFVEANGAEMAETYQRLLDEYVRLSLPGEEQRAFEIICEITDLFLQSQDGGAAMADAMAEHGHGTPESDEKSLDEGDVDEQAAEEARESMVDQWGDTTEHEDFDDDLDGDDADDAEGEDEGEGGAAADEADADDADDAETGEGAADSADDADEGTEGTEGGGEADGADEGDEQGDDPADAEAGQNAEGASADGEGHDDLDVDELADSMSDELRQVAADMLAEIADNVEAGRDVEAYADAIEALLDETPGVDEAQGKRDSRLTATTAADLVAAEDVGRALTQLRTDLDSAWLPESQRGRLDAYRYSTADPGDFDVFDEWVASAEEIAEIEIVVLVDRSSSMSSADLDRALSAGYAIKRSVDQIGGRVTVLAFNVGTPTVIYDPVDEAKPDVRPSIHSAGGTEPSAAHAEAARILLGSAATSRVLVTLTDGEWSTSALREDFGGYGRGFEGEVPAEVTVETLRAEGVKTMLLGINEGVSVIDPIEGSYGATMRDEQGVDPTHGFEIAFDVMSIEDVPRAVETLVESIMIETAGR